jgi:Flp pilus assembly protein CpaB
MILTRCAAISPHFGFQALLIYGMYLYTVNIDWGYSAPTAMGLLGIVLYIIAILLSGANFFLSFDTWDMVERVEHTRFKKQVVAAQPLNNGQVRVAKYTRTSGWGPWANEAITDIERFDAVTGADEAYAYANELRETLKPQSNIEAVAVAKQINEKN